jgi:polyferredoxin
MTTIFSRPSILWFIFLSLGVALAVPFFLHFQKQTSSRHVIEMTAGRYGYFPERIIVNQGDTIVLKTTSKDVTHGFSLDGYPVDLIIKQQGITFQKFYWTEDDGSIQFDWDKVTEVEFIAEHSGKFVYRCTLVCGSLHPFMTGELIVSPNTPYHLAVSLSFWLTASLLLLGATPGTGIMSRHPAKGINLLDHSKVLRWLFTRRSLQFLLLLPMAVIFYLFIISALWGSPVGNRNISIIFVWIFWWFLLKAVFVPLGGRLWCTICPLPAPGEWLTRKTLTAVRTCSPPIRGLRHKFLGLQWDWPKRFRNMWIQNLVFMAMISFGIMLITRPIATGLVFVLILVVTITLALLFRRRVFCLYICPVSGFLGTYSMASMTAVRAVDPDICRKHKDKACLQGNESGWGCPWGQYLGTMNRNSSCGCCTECFKSCPKGNVGFFLRPFGRGGELKGYDEMFNVIMMLVVALAFSITMMSPWSVIRDAANVSESRNIPAFLAYLAVLWGSALVIFPGLFLLLVQVGKRLSRSNLTTRQLALASSTMLIPIGIFSWIAFSLPSVMINYGYIIYVINDPMGLGWDLFGWAQNYYPPFLPDWIPNIQGVLLLIGLSFGIRRGYLSVNSLIPDPAGTSKALILPSMFALATINILLRLYMG